MSTQTSAIKQPQTQTQSLTNVRTITTLAMITAISFVISYLSKAIPSVMGFLDFDFKDVVICIGGFVFGPVAAAVVSIVSSVINMFFASSTGPIGCLMNILATCAFCCTASFFYKKFHTMKGAIVGLFVGIVMLTAVMLLWNYLITPYYMEDVSREYVASLLVPVFLPFNIAKGGLNMAATLLLYKPVVTALRRAGLVEIAVGAPERKSYTGVFLFALALLATFIVFALVLLGIL